MLSERRKNEARIQAAFLPLDPTGGIANECWSDYQKKLDTWHAQRPTFEKFLQDWASIRAELETIVRPPELLIEILQRMGSPTQFEQLQPPTPEEYLRFAFVNAAYIRNRFTIADLFIFLIGICLEVWDSVWNTSRTLASATAPIASHPLDIFSSPREGLTHSYCVSLPLSILAAHCALFAQT